jgi:hypothetical protein
MNATTELQIGEKTGVRKWSIHKYSKRDAALLSDRIANLYKILNSITF